MHRSTNSTLTFLFNNIIIGSSSDKECVPFVSEYSDCTEANICTGCRRCSCGSEATWNCNYVTECPILDKVVDREPEMVDNALDMLKSVIASGKTVHIKPALIKDKETNSNDLLMADGDIDQQILSLMSRRRRDTANNNETHDPIEFFNIVNELNEDTLKNSNDTGTITAATFQPNLQQTRRFENSSQINDMNYLNIKNDGPIEQNIMDNAIDVSNKKDHKLSKVGSKNATINKRDKIISKIIVDEIKPGEERIGDITGPVISKISFTPENDTITAMAYIAGNLLNKLWYMEKGSEESSEIDKIKKEKIDDLLEVFKAPLTIRQETFLKNALEILSKAVINKEENSSNVDSTLCEKLRAELASLNNDTNDDEKIKEEEVSSRKMANILNLLNEYKSVKNTLEHVEESNTQETSNATSIRPVTENKDHALFAKLLEKVTKLLSPEPKQKSIIKNVRKLNLFRKNLNLHPKLKELFNLDPDDLNLSIKDKVIIDYLNAMQEQPNCLLGTIFNRKNNIQFLNGNIEENILLNLSEFYKIKSYTDLLKLLSSKEKTEPIIQGKRSNTSILNDNTTEVTTVKSSEKPSNQTKNVKELLKQHLKELLTDLKELKNDNEEDFDIAEVLPCLSHFIKSEPGKFNIKTKQVDTPAGRLIKTLNQLKADLKNPTRRSQMSDDFENVPKSLIIWNRVINNLDMRASGRRSNILIKPKNIDDTIYALSKLNATLKTFNNGKNVLPSDRLILLKVILIDIKQYIYEIENLDQLLEINTINNEKIYAVNQLLNDAKRNLHEREVILANMKNKLTETEFENEFVTKSNNHNAFASAIVVEKPKPIAPKQLSDDYLNKIIIDRVKVILRTINKYDDPLRYNVAKKIIDNFNAGNPTIARELYKILVAKKDHSKEASMMSDLPGAIIPKQDKVMPEMKYIGMEESQESMWL